MNDDDRRVCPALVRVAELRPNHAGAWRLLPGERRLQRPDELGCGQSGHRRRIRPIDRGEQASDSLALACRNRVQLGKAQETELALELALDPRTRVGIGRVPFVDGDHQRAPGLEDVPGDMRILLGNSLLRIEQQDDDVCVRYRLQRLDHREFLDRFGHLAPTAHPGGVDQRVAPGAAIEVEIDRIARSARLFEGDDALLAQQRVDQRRFADVGPADDRDANSLVLFRDRLILGRGGRGAHGERMLDQLAHVLAVRGGDRQRGAERELVKFGAGALGGQAFGFVHGDQHGPARAAEQVGDRAILAGHAFAAVDQEDDCVGLRDRRLGLSCHGAHDAAPGPGLEASGVDDEIGSVAAAPAPVVAVAGEPGVVGDQGSARRGQAVEEGRFADIGPADEHKRREHGIDNVLARSCNFKIS